MLDPAARRLVVASVARLHVARTIGTGPVGPDDAEDLARRLAADPPPGLACDPPFPGATAGPEQVRGGIRLVLTCRVLGAGEPVLVTALVPGRPPAVVALPPDAAVALRPRGDHGTMPG